MLNHKGTATLTTPRLTLRRFEIADAQAMFDNWANDPRVTRHLTCGRTGRSKIRARCSRAGAPAMSVRTITTGRSSAAASRWAGLPACV